MALGGDLQAIKEVGDKLDGKCAQVVGRGDVPLEEIPDGKLFAIIRNQAREPLDKPSYAQLRELVAWRTSCWLLCPDRNTVQRAPDNRYYLASRYIERRRS
jgi:hypothetical protein